jgi:hypothetical protein
MQISSSSISVPSTIYYSIQQSAHVSEWLELERDYEQQFSFYLITAAMVEASHRRHRCSRGPGTNVCEAHLTGSLRL